MLHDGSICKPLYLYRTLQCAGTSLREVFTMLAEKEGWSGAIVEECRGNAIKLRKRAEQLLPVRTGSMLSVNLVCVPSRCWDARSQNHTQYATPGARERLHYYEVMRSRFFTISARDALSEGFHI